MSEPFMIDGKRACYYINPSQDPKVYGGYVPSLVQENTPGHLPMLGRGDHAAPWIWGQTLSEAEAVCDAKNKELGIDEEAAFKLLASSMFPR